MPRVHKVTLVASQLVTYPVGASPHATSCSPSKRMQWGCLRKDIVFKNIKLQREKDQSDRIQHPHWCARRRTGSLLQFIWRRQSSEPLLWQEWNAEWRLQLLWYWREGFTAIPETLEFWSLYLTVVVEGRWSHCFVCCQQGHMFALKRLPNQCHLSIQQDH